MTLSFLTILKGIHPNSAVYFPITWISRHHVTVANMVLCGNAGTYSMSFRGVIVVFDCLTSMVANLRSIIVLSTIGRPHEVGIPWQPVTGASLGGHRQNIHLVRLTQDEDHPVLERNNLWSSLVLR